MNNPLTYADLDYALLQLGFEKRIWEEKHFLYCHRETETLVTFPICDPNERIRMGHDIRARRVIDGRGVADGCTFDILMWINHLCTGTDEQGTLQKELALSKAQAWDLQKRNEALRGCIKTLPAVPFRME
jgi:hypothetical protein